MAWKAFVVETTTGTRHIIQARSTYEARDKFNRAMIRTKNLARAERCYER